MGNVPGQRRRSDGTLPKTTLSHSPSLIGGNALSPANLFSFGVVRKFTVIN